MSKTILALDQSSRISGWSVFKDGELFRYGKFELIGDVDIRLVKIRSKVKELIEEYQPDIILLENIQEQNNILTYKILAETLGVLEELAAEMQIPHELISAATWKSTLGIKGKTRPEQKRNAQAYVTQTYGITPTQDECDSICIGAHYTKKNNCAW